MWFTHRYDFLGKYFTLIAASSIALPYFLFKEDAFLTWHWHDAVFFIIVTLFSNFAAAILLPRWIPTYLYIRLSLMTRVTKDEADDLTYLFDGSMNGAWYPMKQCRKIQKNQRREFLFSSAYEIVKNDDTLYNFLRQIKLSALRNRIQKERSEKKSAFQCDKNDHADSGIYACDESIKEFLHNHDFTPQCKRLHPVAQVSAEPPAGGMSSPC